MKSCGRMRLIILYNRTISNTSGTCGRYAPFTTNRVFTCFTCTLSNMHAPARRSALRLTAGPCSSSPRLNDRRCGLARHVWCA